MTLKVLPYISMGKPLKRGPLKFMLTHVCGEARRHTPVLNTHDFTVHYLKDCNTLLQEK